MASTADLVTQSVGDLTVEDKQEKTFFQKNWKEKKAFIREVITVEPLIAAYVIPSVLCSPALTVLEFEKACRVNLGYNETICDAILSGTHQNFTTQNNEVLVKISNMHSWQSPVQSVMPLILVLFLGSFSDRRQWRKPFLLLPIIGEFFSVIAILLCVLFMDTWPLEAQGVAQTVIPSFFGGQTMITMAVFAYIADVSSLEMRTLRIGIVQIVLNFVLPVVQSFSAHLFYAIGYSWMFIIAACFYLFGLLYGIFYIKEPREPIKSSFKELILDIFNPLHAIETFSIMLVKRKGNNRIYIILVMFILFIYSGVNSAEGGLFFLYAQSIFHWTQIEFIYFLTVNTLVHLVGTILAVPLFTKVLNLSDFTILLLTFIDKIIPNIVFGLAKIVPLLYTAAVLSIITGVTPIGIRSLATKIVSTNDLGKAQSLFSICESLAPAVMIPLYNTAIYVRTLDVFPAAFFFFGALLYVICSAIVVWMFFMEKSKQRRFNSNAKNNEEKKSQFEDIQITHI